jgi:hypothetical protein
MDWLAWPVAPWRAPVVSLIVTRLEATVSDTERAKSEESNSRKEKATEFTVDGEELTSEEKTLTPREIMAMAGVDSATHYLVEIRKQGEQVSYEGQPDATIRVHKDMRFVTISSGPTPVS